MASDGLKNDYAKRKKAWKTIRERTMEHKVLRAPGPIDNSKGKLTLLLACD